MRLARSHSFPFIALGLLAFVGSARATSVAPISTYTKPSADGRFVFVMFAPGSLDAELQRWRKSEKMHNEILAIRTKYPSSGLYRADGSTAPLWTVDWFSRWVDVGSDGVHVVRHRQWPSQSSDDAISFFANGRHLRTYTISQLTDLRPLMFCDPPSAWFDSGKMDNGELAYNLRTSDWNSYTFDLKTGEIISQFRLGRIIKWAAILLLAAAVLRSIINHWRKRLNRLRSGLAT